MDLDKFIETEKRSFVLEREKEMLDRERRAIEREDDKRQRNRKEYTIKTI